jgi:hypothetical protein
MAAETDNAQDPQPMDSGNANSQQSAQPDESSPPGQRPNHGTTGEGAGSAMARLISQEQARIVPGKADDAATGSS